MKSGQSYELELISHHAKLPLEPADRGVIQFLLPVERWRAIVSQQFVRMMFVDTLGKAFGLCQVWFAGFAPEQVDVRGVANRTRNGLVNTGPNPIESLHASFAGGERLIALIDVASEQVSGIGIRSCNE